MLNSPSRGPLRRCAASRVRARSSRHRRRTAHGPPPGADAQAVFTSRDNGTPRAVLLLEPADRILLQKRRVTLALRNAYTLAHLEAGFTLATGPLADLTGLWNQVLC